MTELAKETYSEFSSLDETLKGLSYMTESVTPSRVAV